MGNYQGFKLFVPREYSIDFFKRCSKLGLCFNNGAEELKKLQEYEECYAYIFWDNKYAPYIGSNKDYIDDENYYESYVQKEMNIHFFLRLTRFKNVTAVMSTSIKRSQRYLSWILSSI